MCQAKLECRKTKLEHYLGVSPSTISKLKVKFHLKGNVRQATKWASQEDETKKDSFLNLSPLKRQHTVNLQSHVTPRRPFTIRPVYAGADNMCTVS